MDRRNFKWGIVNKTVAPINLHPKFESEMADEGIFGMVVKISDDAGGGWYKIETHYDYSGYMHESNIIFGDEKSNEWKNKAKSVVTHSIVDVLAEPKYQSYTIELLVRGAVVYKIGNEKDEWVEIELPDNRIGWVRSSFLGNLITTADKNEEDELRENLVNTALSYIGTQYRWGGRTPLGIDCSGLCSISYLLNGVVIYRDAVLKDDYLREINVEDMKPADLLFFPGHVAMYIGNDKIVHSSGSISGVKINSLNPNHSDYREDLAKKIKAVATIF